MLRETSISPSEGAGTDVVAPLRPPCHLPSLLLEIGLLDRKAQVFVDGQVGRSKVATAILEMIYLDLDIPGLVAGGRLPPDEPLPSPILTAWHALSLDDPCAMTTTPYFHGQVDCYETFFKAVHSLRGEGQELSIVERDLEKCKSFTFGALVESWRVRLDENRATLQDEDDAVNRQ